MEMAMLQGLAWIVHRIVPRRFSMVLKFNSKPKRTANGFTLVGREVVTRRGKLRSLMTNYVMLSFRKTPPSPINWMVMAMVFPMHINPMSSAYLIK